MTSKTTNKKDAQAAPKTADAAKPSSDIEKTRPSRLDQLAALLARDVGASIAEMTEATGWQQHSVRGAMAGALKKRGLTITSEKIHGVRRYRASTAA